jgi:hypothetical protein
MTLDNEMRRMQQEAINRVHEMQARAQQKLHNSPQSAQSPQNGDLRNTNSNYHKKNTNSSDKIEPPPPPAAEATHSQGKKGTVMAAPPNTLQDLFDGLMEDRERTMILVLILLLFTENADTSVIFSLLYTIL